MNKHLINLYKAASLLCLIILFEILSPIIMLAASGGRHQMEYVSYESFGSSDIVNLATGDLAYNIPLIEIPGPEGSFKLPITYKSGIKNEQEASWVGLGWNINPGSINRSISVIPDDYAGQVYNTISYDPGGSYKAVNYDISVLAYEFDSEGARGGRISYKGVSVGFGSMEGVSAYGFSVNQSGLSLGPASVSADGFGFKMDVQTSMNIFMNAVAIVGSHKSVDLVPKSEVRLFNTANLTLRRVASIGTNTNNFQYGFWSNEIDQSYNGVKSTYKSKWYLDCNRNSNSFGILYISGSQSDEVDYDGNVMPDGKKLFHVSNDWDNGQWEQDYVAPRINGYKGEYYHLNRMSDIYVSPNNNVLNMTPVSLAYDNYVVNGQGVSGAISPFRVDIGSVVAPKKAIGTTHINFHSTGFLKYSKGDKYIPQFKYLNSTTNYYDYHDLTSNEISYSLYQGYYDNINFNNPSVNQRFDPTNRTTYKDKRLAFGNHIEWATNWDMMSNRNDYAINSPPINYFGENPIYSKKIIDHLPETNQSGGNPRADFRQNFPKLGIGAYSITNSEGYTFHYTLPVYSFNNIDLTKKSTSSSFSRTTMNKKFAVHWLLTSITGPDFIDRDDNGYVNETDWGYWVKFDYGKYNPKYYWRNPYFPNTYNQILQADSLVEYHSYSEGEREVYYLDKISTRSHTAVFIKGERHDGKSAYRVEEGNTTKASKALKLKEIILLKNEDYLELEDNFGFSKDFGGNTTTSEEYNVLENVYDVTDIDQAIRSKLEHVQLSRNVFNYYQFNETGVLCPGTVNSFQSAENPPMPGQGNLGGKLTLKSIELHGKNDIKISPNYSFEYYNELQQNTVYVQNPSYSSTHYDAWGMYNQTGSSNPKEHNYTFDIPGAYSLRSIMFPTGSKVSFEYEKDYYSSVLDRNSNINVNFQLVVPNDGSDNGVIELASYHSNIMNLFEVNDLIKISPNFESGNSFQFLISSISGTMLYSNDTIPISDSIFCCKPYKIEFLNRKVNIPGGNNRVKQVHFDNGIGEQYYNEYVYTVNGNESAVSSGYITKEPLLLQGSSKIDENIYEFPLGPVLYTDVYVKMKQNVHDDFLIKEHYSFFGVDENMINVTSNTMYNTSNYLDMYGLTYNNKGRTYEVYDNTSLVGKLDYMAKYNSSNQLLYKKENHYKSIENDYTSGVILIESIAKIKMTWGELMRWIEFDVNTSKTLSRKSQVFLEGYSEYNNGFRQEYKFSNFDLLTGEPLSTIYTNSKNDRFKSVKIPAYSILDGNNEPLYKKMGSKFNDYTSKNMLTDRAAEYLYIYNEDTEEWDPIKANIQTWANDWEYRKYNTSTGKYEQTETVNNDAYRKKATYVWNGDMREDGRFDNFTDFDWTNPTNNTDWLKTSEFKLYDHYSHLLESEDVAGDFKSTKMNSNQSLVLAQASNARYTEFAFSSAEDELVDNIFGGETRSGNGTIIDKSSDPTHIHTGQKAIKLDGGDQYGFGFHKEVDLSKGQPKMRASVWVHQDNMNRLRLSYNYLDASNESISYNHIQPSASNSYLKAGDWYLVVLEVPGEDDIDLSLADRLSVQAWYPTGQASGAVYIDDFRVHPYDATMVSSVYDESKGELMASISPDGLAERYEYDEAGRVIAIYQEVPDHNGIVGGFKLKKKFNYNYARSTN